MKPYNLHKHLLKLNSQTTFAKQVKQDGGKEGQFCSGWCLYCKAVDLPFDRFLLALCEELAIVSSSVLKPSMVWFIYFKMRQLAIETGLNQFRYQGNATRPSKTGHNQSTTQKQPVPMGCNWSFVVKFIVPNIDS